MLFSGQIAIFLLAVMTNCSSSKKDLPENSRPVELEFFETYSFNELQGSWEMACNLQQAADTLGADGSIPLDEISKRKLRNLVECLYGDFELPEFGTVEAANVEKVTELLGRKEIRNCFPKDVLFLWSLEPDEDHRFKLYAAKLPATKKAALNGKHIREASVVVNDESRYISINLDMTNKGGRIWSQMTGSNVGKYITITLDRKVFSCPLVNEQITGNRTQISGAFSKEEAEKLAAGINAAR